MRTTALWSLVALAGSAVAAPGRAPEYQGETWPETTCTEEEKTTVLVTPVRYGSKATLSKSAPWSYGFSGNSSSHGPTATAAYSGAPSTVTVITTTYSSTNTETTTFWQSGTSSVLTYATPTTVTETLTLTIPAVPVYTPSWHQGSPNGPGAYPSQSQGAPNGSGAYPPQSEVSTAAHGYTVTTASPVYTLGPMQSGSGYAPAVSGSAVVIPEVVTTVIDVTVTASPAPTDYSPVESSSVAGGYGGGAAVSSQSPYVTTIIQTQTIIVEKTTTAVEGSSTVTRTYSGTSLHTTIYTSTCTEGASTIWTTVQYGSSLFSYTLPLTSSASEGLSSAITSSAIVPSEKPWYPIPSGNPHHPGGRPSGYPGSYPGGHPSGYPGSYPSGHPSGYPGSYPGGLPSGHASGSAPVSSGYKSLSTPFPSSTGSIPISYNSSTKSFPSSIVSKLTQSSPLYPTYVSTKTTSSSSSTSTCSKPTSTPETCIPCENQPSSDVDNNCGYTIDDNWYEVTPKTCRTVEYNFEITNGTVSPDGVERIGFLINGQFPGPAIEANWGDTVVVHVTNSLTNNGSTLHFHGIRQFWNSEMDGVPSITQCPLAPGHSMTYTFRATNYGSSWYHSHFAIQTYSGVFGPMIIHGPATADYDEEEMILVQDWNHISDDAIYDAAQTQGPRTLDTGLINGLNVWGGADGAPGTTGERWSMTVVSGKRYRLRLVNVAIQSTFKFYIDNHKFKVIAMDFVPIVPYETEIVNINIGQRYDLIFTADQTPGNYWMRADNQNVCAQITAADNIKAIVTYQGVTAGTPTSTAYTYQPECVDEPLASLVPHVPLNAGAHEDQDVRETVAITKPNNLFKWTLSGTTFQSQWGDPTLQSIFDNGTVPTYSGSLAIEVPNLKEWVYVIIDSPIPTPHPIHLHGHDFYILAQGTGLYSSSVVLNTVNPPRRDVALMPFNVGAGVPSGGHLVLAFEADNPGAWLMHCHIGWHVSMGFALQIIEGQSFIKDTIKDSCQMDEVCAAWNEYTAGSVYDATVTDSGV